jgi:peptidoglycan/LPS O-acetylase OafA/YrhL
MTCAMSSQAPRARVNEIDLLRFVAALSVVLYHYAFRGYAADGLSPLSFPSLAPVAKYGYLGVELFFMISGFVILMTAANGSLRAFITSRVVRLYPAFWACCTLTFVITLVLGSPAGAFSLREFLVNLTMISGFVGVRDIDGSYWSLFVEMRFYALVAIVLLLGRIRDAQWLLLAWLAATAALEVVHIGRVRGWLIAEYSPYFIGGAACYLVWQRGVGRVTSILLAGAWALAVWQSVTSLPALEKHFATHFDPAIVATAVTAFYAALFLVSTRRTGPVANLRWTALGAMTYPLYLLHQVIGFSIFNALHPAVHPQVLLWGTVLLMLAASYAVHILVERPAAPAMKRIINRSAGAAGTAARSLPADVIATQS